MSAKDITHADPQVPAGKVGTVLGLRGSADGPEYLVKWAGRSGPVSCNETDLKASS
jgi:hypothetical protein